MNEVNITNLKLNGTPNFQGIQGGTCDVKGVTKENYNNNRVFFVNGERWVLQYVFGWDFSNGTQIFWAERRGA